MVSLPRTLLVVDDDEANRDMLSRRLERKGFAVAEDGHRAIELIRERPFDLVLLDVLMPGLSGLEVLRELRRSHPATELPVTGAGGPGGSPASGRSPTGGVPSPPPDAAGESPGASGPGPHSARPGPADGSATMTPTGGPGLVGGVGPSARSIDRAGAVAGRIGRPGPDGSLTNPARPGRATAAGESKAPRSRPSLRAVPEQNPSGIGRSQKLIPARDVEDAVEQQVEAVAIADARDQG
jgi:hypothetical protein